MTGFSSLFTGRGPGRVLAVLGLAVAALCFAGWFSIILGGARDLDAVSSPSDFFGATLPSGVPVAAVYFLGFGLGAVLFAVGTSMAKAGARAANLVGHLVVVLVIVVAAVMGLIHVLGGASLAALKPTFSGTAPGTAARTPPQVVVSTPKSVTRGGLTMTVARVENHGGKGVGSAGRRQPVRGQAPTGHVQDGGQRQKQPGIPESAQDRRQPVPRLLAQGADDLPPAGGARRLDHHADRVWAREDGFLHRVGLPRVVAGHHGPDGRPQEGGRGGDPPRPGIVHPGRHGGATD